MKQGMVLTAAFAASFMVFSSFLGGGGPSITGPAHAGSGGDEAAYVQAASAADVDQAVDRPGYTVTVPPPAITGSSGAESASTGASGSDALVSAKSPAVGLPEMVSRPAVWDPDAVAPAGPGCPGSVSGTTASAPSKVSPKGVLGTTSDDLRAFAEAYNRIRVENCLHPVPMSNFRYDACMEARLFWIAEDPSTDPASAWGHTGTVRSDGLPVVGCDGNLAGGSGNTGATVAQKWWTSTAHRASLYRPTVTGPVPNVCIYFAMTHGGVPNEPMSFTRAAARWGNC